MAPANRGSVAAVGIWAAAFCTAAIAPIIPATFKKSRRLHPFLSLADSLFTPIPPD
jgi:hypothetical protein